MLVDVQISKEDFQDVVSLMPENTPLPASERMAYLLARLEVSWYSKMPQQLPCCVLLPLLPLSNDLRLRPDLQVYPGKDRNEALQQVANKEVTMREAIGPAVGCLMATMGTNMISSCIFDFEDPEDLK